MSKKKIAGIAVGCIAAIIVMAAVVSRPAPTYTLNLIVSPSGAGSTSPSGGQYESGVQVTVTANPASGYTFDYWSGDASGSSNATTIVMNSNMIVTAHFKAVDSEPPPERGTLTVHFIDVGQGDSILLDLGDTEVLIDGGKESPGVVDYIDDHIDGPLEVMVATHPDYDHIGGLIDVLAAFEVEEIWHNGDTSTSGTYSRFISAVNSEGANVHVATRGDIIQAGNLTLGVLHPASLDDTINENSIVLSLGYGQVDLFFTGDAGKGAEPSMLAGGVLPDVEILKVGHHGSSSASSMQFLQTVRPECAVYMAGKDNTYGHPHEETITNLCEIGAEIYGTDVHGTITITTDGATYNLLPSKNVPPVACPTATSHALTISVSGQGTTNPSVGTYEYDGDTEATITASPASGWKFDHWNGDASGSSPTIVITMDSDKDITAYFEEEDSIGSNVQITYIFYDGIVPSTEADEYVEITNLGDDSQDLEEWVLKDISEGYPSFAFPSYVLVSGAKIRVYTNEIHPEWGGFSFGYGKAIWNNSDPDWAALYNTQGQEVSRKSY